MTLSTIRVKNQSCLWSTSRSTKSLRSLIKKLDTKAQLSRKIRLQSKQDNSFYLSPSILYKGINDYSSIEFFENWPLIWWNAINQKMMQQLTYLLYIHECVLWENISIKLTDSLKNWRLAKIFMIFYCIIWNISITDVNNIIEVDISSMCANVWM